MAIRLMLLLLLAHDTSTLRLHPARPRQSTAAIRPRAAAPSLVVNAFSNVGETAVFDNVNLGTALIRGLRRMSTSSAEREQLYRAFASLASGLDEIIFISIYLLAIDRLLRALWRTGGWFERLPLFSRGGEAGGGGSSGKPAPAETFERSLLGALRAPARLLGWSMLLVWLVDAAYIFGVGLDPGAAGRLRQLPYALSLVAYTYVSGRAISALKNWWLEQAASYFVPPPSQQQRAVVRRGSGILMWSVLGLLCAEGLAATTGVKVNSILSFAGVGGIAVGLATKDLLTNLVGGCLVFLTNPFTENDKITMTNLDQARIMQIGWYQTVVRGDDEQLQTIPNAKFISNKISNRSRRTHRCMKQSIFLTYDALPDLQGLIDELRAELKKLPSVDASSRDFRVYLKELRQTALEVEVEVHFRGNDGTEYRGKRQGALLTISDVVRRRGAKFAVLDSLLATADGDGGGGPAKTALLGGDAPPIGGAFGWRRADSVGEAKAA